MSNSINQNILHQSLLRHTVLDNQYKLNPSGTYKNTLFQAAIPNQVPAQHWKSPMSTKFLGSSLNVQKPRMATGTSRRRCPVNPHAVLTTDPASEVHFQLEDHLQYGTSSKICDIIFLD